MRNKQNVYKRKKDFHILRIIPSVLFSVLLLSFFTLIGYSVAKPFGKVGESKREISVSDGDISAAEQPEDKISDEILRAYRLPEKEIEDTEALEAMLQKVDKSFNTVIVPLKLKGGKLNYSSVNEGAVMADVCTETEITEIVNTVKRNGFHAAASFNTLEDNLYPKADKSSGFTYKDTGKLWYDADEKKGGKAWLSPSAPSAGAYLTSLTTEIAAAGFEYIIATGAEYPAFSRIGFDAIGESVTNENRYLDLIDIVNKTAAAAEARGSEMWIEISAAEMFAGTCEVFEPLLLETKMNVLEINIDEFKGKIKCGDTYVDFSDMTLEEKIEKICQTAETYLYKTSFIPEITGSSITAADKKTAAETFERLGYKSYILN